jgi:H+/Cl- antiporter ClcA
MNFLRSLININSADSSRSFTLVVSSFISILIGVIICFAIVWDVIHNDYIKTDMENVGIFMLCLGGYVAGSSVSKVFPNKLKGTKAGEYMETIENDDKEEINQN